MTEACDLCGATGLTPVYRADDTARDLTVHLCPRCGLVQSLPRVHRVEQRRRALSSGAGWGNIRYGKGFRTGFALQLIGRLRPLDRLRRVLDVGANRGSFLFTLEAAVPQAELWGVEPDDSILGDYPAHPSIRLLPQRFEDCQVPAGYFDLIYCSHTLEHVTEPSRVLAAIREAMCPDGLLLAEVPNLDFVAGDDLLEEFFIDKHLYHYSPASFAQALAVVGFEPLETAVDRENVTILARFAEPKPCRPDQEEAERARHWLANYGERLRHNRLQLRTAAARIAGFAPRRVAVWGGGRLFDSLVIHGGLDPHTLCGLYDRDLPRYVEQVHGIPVLAPDRLGEAAPEVLVIASRAYFEEIRDHARSLAHWPMEIFSLFDLMNPGP